MRQTTRDRLENAGTNGTANQEDVTRALEFIDYYSSTEQLSPATTSKYCYALRALLEQLHILNKKAASLDEKTVLKLMDWLRTSEYSEDTRLDYWDRFTRFWTWAADRAADEDQAWDAKAYRLMADAKHKIRYRVNRNKQGKKGTLTEEEILQVIDAEANLCYKAFFSVLYESGMRSAEALGLRIRDVISGENGTFTIHLRVSKTEKRPIPLLNGATNYLRKWLAQHPHRNNTNAQLWLNTLGEPVTNPAANKQLRHVLKAARINKSKISLHSFRHSRATHLAGKGLTEFELCRLFGWKIGSSMPATYIRAGALDVTTALRRASGLPVEQKERAPAGKRCLQCDHHNSLDADFCDVCNLPLDAERLSVVKQNVHAIQTAELAKKYARTVFKEEIHSVIEELGLRKKTTH